MKSSMRTVLNLFLVACTGLFTGCAADTEEQDSEEVVASGVDALIGGKPEFENTSAMVVLFDNNNQALSLCSASQIGPRVMLTAAHCTRDENASHYKVFFGRVINSYEFGSPELASVSAVAADPRFNEQQLQEGHDVGLLLLAEDGKANTYPINRAEITRASFKKPALLSGYGEQDRRKNTFTAGEREKLDVKLNGFFKFRGRTFDSVLDYGSIKKTSCHGDSGGPALMTINGRRSVVGVTSFGFDTKTRECVGRGYYARVDMSADFIDRMAGGWSATLAE